MTSYPVLAAIALDLVEPAPVAATGPLAWHRALEEWPGARDGHAMAYDVARRRVVLFGRGDDARPDRIWEYDGAGWHGTPLVASPGRRRDLAAAYDTARSRTLFFGGADLDAKAVGDTWLWDGTSATRALPPLSPPARYWSAMAYDAARGRVVLVGGTGGDEDPEACHHDCDATWEWDGKAWSKRTPTPAPSPRWGHAMAYDAARRKVVLFGGSSYVGGCGLEGCNDTWEWDGAVWLERAASGPSKRRFAAMAFDASRQRVVLFGGSSDACPAKTCGDTWEWDGRAWKARSPSPAPSARAQHAMAYDEKRRRVVLYGGGSDKGRKSDTWEWDGTTWTPRWQPPGVSGAELAFDPATRRVLLFGGRPHEGNEGETFTWDGAAWELQPGTAPPAREGHAMVGDLARKRVLLFGGESVACGSPQTGPGPCGDTWFWDGARWSIATGAGPSARSGHAMAYDADRSRVVLFGGRTVGGSASTETWEHDGRRWSKASDAGPEGLDPVRMAYDAERRRLVLVRSTGTWEWEGGAWVERPAAKLPRDRSALAYDRSLRRVVAFGGTSSACTEGYCDDLWQWDGRSWSVVDLAVRPPRRVGHSIAYDDARSELVLYGGVDHDFVRETWVLRARK